MKVIAVNGISKSGKTTVCEALIKGLRKRGYSVGSVKEIHFESFAIDPDPNTNTSRHRAAGAQLVTARALWETDVLYQKKLPVEEILHHYQHDYVILEGVAECNAPIILTAHTLMEVEQQLDERVIAISGVVANSSRKSALDLPLFNALSDPDSLVDFAEKRAFEPLPSFEPQCCSACGYSCRELAGLVAQKKAKREDCVLSSAWVELFVDVQRFPSFPLSRKNSSQRSIGSC